MRGKQRANHELLGEKGKTRAYRRRNSRRHPAPLPLRQHRQAHAGQGRRNHRQRMGKHLQIPGIASYQRKI